MTSSNELVEVRLETFLGACYSFPDMDVSVLSQVLPKGENRVPEGHGQIQLMNASVALLSVPFRIVEKIFVNGELWWKNPNKFEIPT